MGFFDDIWEGFKDICSSVVETVKETFHKAGEVISAVFKEVLPAIAPILQVIIPVFAPHLIPYLPVITKCIESVGKSLGWLDRDFDTKTMGKKAIAAAAESNPEERIVPENYDNHKDYLEALKNYSLSPEREAEISEKEACLTGLGLMSFAVKDHIDPKDFKDLIILVTRDMRMFNSERLAAYLKAVDNASYLVAYFDGSLKGYKRDEVEKSIVSAEKSLEANYDKTEAELTDTVRALRGKL